MTDDATRAAHWKRWYDIENAVCKKQQAQLDAKDAEIARLTRERDEALAKVATLVGAIKAKRPRLNSSHDYSRGWNAALFAIGNTDPDATAALNRVRAGERAALGREVLERLRHEIAIKPTLTYADAIEWVETILARADAVERGE
ncbi:hypothetical protein PE067_09525 [Paracoccus sp. DMF-8]|uniref:hypothetical protein n=1 Tax=Paracoccus sp. DMF-8 TaxID=3019445 RepID=UPI0023E8D664|nr:hypothetical protein [Paracoccus sp. DMF-8]MDF3606359.1 hypothetical protein [Paracoccus sp. DMF-8]